MTDLELLGELKRCYRYEPKTGEFHHIRPGRWFGRVAGTKMKIGYTAMSIAGTRQLGHRAAFLYMTGELPKMDVDHINGNRADNKWSNLRDVSTRVNLQNRLGAQKNSRTGVLGVSWYPRHEKYCARIKFNGVYKNLGYFVDIEDARAAYLTAKRLHHVGCTI